jgi:hypothetical protein
VKNRPTAEQVAEFDRYVAKWQRVLNLRDWRIERGQKPAQRGAMAEVECHPGARLATYRLGDWAGEEINSGSLSKTALHEVLHVFLYDLIVTASDHRSIDGAIETAEHRVINVLENLIDQLPDET